MMRTLVQMDVQNLFFSAKDIDKRIDFVKIRDHFMNSATDELMGIYAYIIRTPDADYHKFEGLLRSLQYKLVIKQAVIGHGSEGQRVYLGTDHDIAICIDCMRNINNFDKWVLMSGDGDFIDLCRYLKEQNKFVEVWSVKGSSFNKGFCDYADEIKFLGPSFFYDKNSVTKKEPPCAAQE